MFKNYFLMIRLIVNFCVFLFFFNAVQAQEKANTPVEEVERLTKLQGEYYRLGNYETFKIYTDSILTLAKANNLKEFEIDAIIRLGVYYKKINKYEQSLPYYLKALKLSKELTESYKRVTVVLINLGNLYNLIGYHNKAKDVFIEASSYIEEFGGPDEYKMATYIGLSESSSANKSFKVALEYLEKAKKIGVKLKRDDILIAVYNHMGDNYLQLKQYEQALAYSKKAEALYTNEQSAERRALSLYLMGASLVGLKKYNDAIVPLQMAQGIAFTNNYLKTQMDTHKQLAKAFEKLGDLQKANLQQKGYINAQQKYLPSLSEAKRLKVEKELADAETLLKRENKYKWILILLSFITVTILLGILFTYTKKKKEAQLEALQLKENQVLLKDENEVLKTKIYKLSLQKKVAYSAVKKVKSGIKKSSLTQKEKDSYVQHILDYMEKEQPFLDHEINQSTLAEKLGMSVHLFSEVLNSCFEKNFNSFINLYRVDRAKQLMKNPKYNHYKVLAIGYESGFSSKTSFNRVFKQLIEKTPSEYREQLFV